MNLSKVKEIFIDATYNTSKINTHFYAIVAEELEYGIPVGFMLMSMSERENPETSVKYDREASFCNHNFYVKAKTLSLDPRFIHTDRDFSEINPAKVIIMFDEIDGRLFGNMDIFFSVLGISSMQFKNIFSSQISLFFPHLIPTWIMAILIDEEEIVPSLIAIGLKLKIYIGKKCFNLM